MNKLVERDVINDSLRGQHSVLKSAFLFKGFTAPVFPWCSENLASCRVIGGNIWKDELARDWFGSIFVKHFNIEKMRIFSRFLPCKLSCVVYDLYCK